jgi:hypothetical protein
MATSFNSIILDAPGQALGVLDWLKLLERQEPTPLNRLVFISEKYRLDDGIAACAVEAGEEMGPREPNSSATRDALRQALMATYDQPADYFTHNQPLAAYVIDGRLPGIGC